MACYLMPIIIVSIGADIDKDQERRNSHGARKKEEGEKEEEEEEGGGGPAGPGRSDRATDRTAGRPVRPGHRPDAPSIVPDANRTEFARYCLANMYSDEEDTEEYTEHFEEDTSSSTADVEEHVELYTDYGSASIANMTDIEELYTDYGSASIANMDDIDELYIDTCSTSMDDMVEHHDEDDIDPTMHTADAPTYPYLANGATYEDRGPPRWHHHIIDITDIIWSIKSAPNMSHHLGKARTVIDSHHLMIVVDHHHLMVYIDILPHMIFDDTTQDMVMRQEDESLDMKTFLIRRLLPLAPPPQWPLPRHMPMDSDATSASNKATFHGNVPISYVSAKKLYFDELNAQVSKMPPLEDDLGGDGVEHGSTEDEFPLMEKMYMVHEDDDISPCLLQDGHVDHMDPPTSTTPTSHESAFKGADIDKDQERRNSHGARKKEEEGGRKRKKRREEEDQPVQAGTNLVKDPKGASRNQGEGDQHGSRKKKGRPKRGRRRAPAAATGRAAPNRPALPPWPALPPKQARHCRPNRHCRPEHAGTAGPTKVNCISTVDLSSMDQDTFCNAPFTPIYISTKFHCQIPSIPPESTFFRPIALGRTARAVLLGRTAGRTGRHRRSTASRLGLAAPPPASIVPQPTSTPPHPSAQLSARRPARSIWLSAPSSAHRAHTLQQQPSPTQLHPISNRRATPGSFPARHTAAKPATTSSLPFAAGPLSLGHNHARPTLLPTHNSSTKPSRLHEATCSARPHRQCRPSHPGSAGQHIPAVPLF
ncbi:hypothetical protein QYE76_018173 [Lolium multiflorum]|uniref:Uncharacterized protein n=1 Tax=Lolium multiflorum TaxID=4521 RepID=A0AAD8QJA9_LOLMU|nr:hypothetical protein QYE76_018173 [Lolium multiflorum]